MVVKLPLFRKTAANAFTYVLGITKRGKRIVDAAEVPISEKAPDDFEERIAEAGDPETPNERLVELQGHEHFRVRAAAAGNETATLAMRLTAMKDFHPTVRAAAVFNGEEVVLGMAFVDEHKTVRQTAAAHPAASEQQLVAALGDEAVMVRMAAASNPAATVDVLVHGLADDNEQVRGQVVMNPTATPELLSQARARTILEKIHRPLSEVSADAEPAERSADEEE